MNRKTLALIVMGAILFVGLVVGLRLVAAETPADPQTMMAANNLYEAGYYAEAAQIYEELIAQGVEDSALFYNLGNAYFQQGDLGRAVLNFQRAAQLDPRDPDIRANLELARAQAVEFLPETPDNPLFKLADFSREWLTLNETAVLALLFWFLFAFLLLASRQLRAGGMKRVVRFTAVLVLMLLLISSFSLGTRLVLEQSQPGGVLITPAVAVSEGS